MSTPSAIHAARGLLAGICLLWTMACHAASFTELVDTARDQIRNEQFVAGLASAKDAVRANPSDHRGHYYVAFALMGMGRLDDAQSEADLALALAPPDTKEGVDKLILAIKNRRGFSSNTELANAALAEGLMGKAARLFEQAWNAGRDNPDAGFKAAELYAGKLSQPIEASRVLRQVAASGGGPDVQAKAEAELAKLAKTLSQIAKRQIAAAREQQQGGDIAAALASLQQAEDADPADVEIHVLRAQMAASGKDAALMDKAMRGLAANNAASTDRLAALPNMLQWLKQPQFREFMIDLIGPNRVAEASQKIQKTNDDWAEYLKKKGQHQQDTIDEENRSRACHAALPAALERCLKAAPMGGLFGNTKNREAHLQQCHVTNEQSVIDCAPHTLTPPRAPAARPVGAAAD